MSEVGATPASGVRPRDGSWGSPEAGGELRRIAEDVRNRASFKVCAIEVLRGDDMLEFVAIAGSPDGEARLLGQASPLDVMSPVLGLGAEYGALTFVAQEWLTPDAARQLEHYGWVPDIADGQDPDQWRALDMLAARIVDDRGNLRALLYLDEPTSGRRPGRAHLRWLAESMKLSLRAVLTTIEREELGQQLRLAGAAREVVRAASSRLGYRELLAETQRHLAAGFRADDLGMHVYGDPASEPVPRTPAQLPPALLTAATEAARRCWQQQTVVIMEPGRVWGAESLDTLHLTHVTRHLADHGVGELVVVPIGAGPEPLGMLVLARAVGGARWTEGESSAALDVGHDLGRAILNTRARDREVELITQLQRLDDYRSRLISTVSHELKNPLGVIDGHLELLEAFPDLPPTVQSSLRAIGRGSGRLMAVVEDLLMLSRMGNPDTPLRRSPVDVASVLSDVMEDLEVLVHRHDVKIQVATLDRDVVVQGDGEEVTRLLTNLLGNAVKYSQAGSVVRTSLVRRADEVVFECADQGLGISEADQEQLFSEFFRSTNPDALARPGTGLGLAIVKRIVDRHGGRIDLQSELGVGTTFRVALPVG